MGCCETRLFFTSFFEFFINLAFEMRRKTCSKILDFLATFKEWDYSVSDIAKNSGISFKTALSEIKNLEQQVVLKTRTVGKATMYKLNLKSKQGFYVDKLIFELATKRVLDSKREIKKVII